MVTRLPGYSFIDPFTSNLNKGLGGVQRTPMLFSCVRFTRSVPCFPEMVKLHGDEFPISRIFKNITYKKQIHVFSPWKNHWHWPVFCVMLDCWGHFHKILYSNDFQGWDPSFFLFYLGGRSGYRKLHGGALRFESSRVGFFTTHGLRSVLEKTCDTWKDIWPGAMVKHCFIQGE